MNEVQVCFRHVSSMLQVQVCSGMFQVYVTSLNILQGQTSFKGFMPMFQGPRATTFQGLIAIKFMLQDWA